MAAPLDPSRPDRAAVDRVDGGWRALLRLGVSDFAWEFLRRNADYRADFVRAVRRPAALDPRWGLRFATDPALAAPEAPVFWRADIAPGLVVPFEAPPTLSAQEGRSWRPRGAVERSADDGLHVRLCEGLQLQYRGEARPGGPLLVVLDFDQDFGLRVRAIERLHRAAAGMAAPPSRLTPAQRERLAKSLMALDGVLGGDSYRAIATRLFGTTAVAREVWKTSSVRATTIRLVQAGRGLMAGGYLKVLRSGL